MLFLLSLWVFGLFARLLIHLFDGYYVDVRV